MEYMSIMLLFIIVLFCGYMFYVLSNYYSSGLTQQGYSYMSYDGKLFTDENINIDDCVEKCANMSTCKGITYDSSQNNCYGSSNGKLRADDSHIFAWVKNEEIESVDNVVVAEATSHVVIPPSKLKIAFPKLASVNLWLNIGDWYHNYKKWKCVLFQGDEFTDDFNFSKWSDVTGNVKQKYGIWLSPFTNNLRVCVGVKKYKNTCPTPVDYTEIGQTCNELSEMYTEYEFVDIKNVAVNRDVMITLVIDGNNLKVYYNGNLMKDLVLSGDIDNLMGSLYVKKEMSFGGKVMNMTYFNKTLEVKKIHELYINGV